MNAIYADNFRHFYSAFYVVVDRIMRGEQQDEVLMDNLNRLRLLVEKDQDEAQAYSNLYSRLPKLVDHIDLELSRYRTIIQSEQRYLNLNIKNNDLETRVQKAVEDIEKANSTLESSKRDYSELEDKINKTSDKIAAAQSQIDSAEEKANKTERALKKTQQEYITILGIFASIVLAFTGGIAYSTSVLDNLHQASIYRILAIAVIIGFVLFNLIYLLLLFILTISGEKGTEYKRLFWFVNIFLVAILICTSIGWFFGMAEKRDQRLYSFDPSPVATSSISVLPVSPLPDQVAKVQQDTDK